MDTYKMKFICMVWALQCLLSHSITVFTIVNIALRELLDKHNSYCLPSYINKRHKYYCLLQYHQDTITIIYLHHTFKYDIL